MGKRELLLAAVFVVVGVVVYQVTAPPADPSRPGFSLSRIVQEIRRELREDRESAEGTATRAIPVPDAVREIRLGVGSTTVTVTGEDRGDIAAELHVRSTGYDLDEARRLVKETHDRLRIDEAGALLILNLDYPREGRQTATLQLKVPRQIGVRLDAKRGPLTISHVAAVTIGTGRGDTTISGVAGNVSLQQQGSTLRVTDVGAVRLQTSGSAETQISNVRGDTTLTLQGGELRAERLGGALEVEARNAEMRFEHLDALRGPVRMNTASSRLELTGVTVETRIDGRDSEIRVQQNAAVPLAIYNSGTRPVELTLPGGGFRVDALAIDGRVVLDEALEKAGLQVIAPPEASGGDTRREVRVNGSVRGGGPSITLRANRGDILLRAK